MISQGPLYETLHIMYNSVGVVFNAQVCELQYRTVKYLYIYYVYSSRLSQWLSSLNKAAVIDFLEEMLYLANCDSLQICLLPQTDISK